MQSALGLDNNCLFSGKPREPFMSQKTSTAVGLAFVLVLVAGSARATAVEYFKTQGDASGVLTGTPVASASDFLGTLLGGYSTETFEIPASTNEVALPLTPYSIKGGTISPRAAADWDGVIQNVKVKGGNFPGRFNTTKAPAVVNGADGHWFETTMSFTIDLSSASTAFGMYMTDLGDFNGSLDVDFCNGSNCINYAFTSLATVTGTLGNGALSFLGYTNNTTAFNRVQVNLHQNTSDPFTYDVVGFDDLIVGNVKNPASTTPEPTSLALTGLALALAGHLARRRRA
jgi:hypothetical protein